MEFDYLLSIWWVAAVMLFIAPMAIAERRNECTYSAKRKRVGRVRTAA
jgi:hypothetical protein